MRGTSEPQPIMIAYVNLEKRVPIDHPLRKIKVMTDEELQGLSPIFNGFPGSDLSNY